MGQLSRKDFKEGNHPVHLINSAEGNLSTSALIPFCAFAGDMAVVGRSVDGFSLPVCNIFHPREVHLYIFRSFHTYPGGGATLFFYKSKFS